MPVLLVLLFIVVPLVELYVIIKVGQLIGVWWTIGLLLLDSILGATLLRSQGRTVWRRFRQALDEGRMPHREVFDGVLVIFGGALLLTPGFVTDFFGLLLLIPPTRAVIRRILGSTVLGRFALGGRVAVWGADRVRTRQPGDRPYDVDGTAQDVTRGDRGPAEGPGKRSEPRLPPP